MLIIILLVLFVGISGDVLEPQFQVLTPDELMVEIPLYGDMKLVTFRIGLKRKDHEEEDLELGENVVNNNRIFIYNERLNLKKEDVINYLLAVADKKGYRAQTGNYVFDGVYYKKPFGRNHRFRRDVTEPTIQKAESNENLDSSEQVNPADSRFGYKRNYGHHHGHFHYGPPFFGPQFAPYPPHHKDELCDHPQHWQSTTPVDVNYHCRLCSAATTEKITTTTEFADIDIRFNDD